MSSNCPSCVSIEDPPFGLRHAQQQGVARLPRAVSRSIRCDALQSTKADQQMSLRRT
jgi:hypothetical protein